MPWESLRHHGTSTFPCGRRASWTRNPHLPIVTSHFWLAFAAYLLPTFPLGYFWHLRTFTAQYDRLEIYRPQPVIPIGLGSMALQGLLYAWVYPRLFDTSPGAWITSALQFAGFFGILAWSIAVLPVAAKNRMSSVGAFLRLETAFTLVHYAIVSPLIALAWRGAQ
jgi:hypothetical protein